MVGTGRRGREWRGAVRGGRGREEWGYLKMFGEGVFNTLVVKCDVLNSKEKLRSDYQGFYTVTIQKKKY